MLRNAGMATGRPKRYRRRLSPVERYNVVINEISRYNVDAMFEGSGDLDVETLRRAVAQAAAANPGARVCLRSFLGFSRWVDSGRDPEVHEVNGEQWDGASERGAPFLERRFDPLRGDPVFDVLLVRGQPLRLIFRGLHAAMDARGLNHVILDIFRVLRGEAPQGSDSPLRDIDVQRQFAKQVDYTPPGERRCLAALPLSAAADETLRYCWRRVRLTRNVSNLMPKLAVFLAREARRIGGEQGDVVFTVPVDLRGLRTEASSTGNLTGYVRIAVQPEERARDLMRRLNDGIKKYHDCFVSPAMRVIPWVPLSVMTKQLRAQVDDMLYTPHPGLPTGGLVSLGHFDVARYSCPGFEASGLFGIPGAVGKLNIVIHNFSDCAELIFSVPARYNGGGQLEAMIERFRADIDA